MYLAFDIGIANLAYCIIDNKGKIKSWDIINLTDKVEEPSCSGKTKKGDICGKRAKFVCKNVEEAFCLTHSKNVVEKKLYPVINPPICQHAKCSAKIKHHHKDNCYIGWCGTHIKQKCVGDKDDYVEYIKPLGAAQLAKDIDLLTDRLFARLDQMDFLLEVDHVGLENQPCLKQPLMKSIQIALYSYLKIRGGIDKGENGIKTFKMINATQKCKKKSKSYAQRKKDSIEECRAVLEADQEEWLPFFDKHKKKDDLADSYNLVVTLLA